MCIKNIRFGLSCAETIETQLQFLPMQWITHADFLQEKTEAIGHSNQYAVVLFPVLEATHEGVVSHF
jgi:hypothetical protein